MRKGIKRLSVGYILIFIQILFAFHYSGAVNPLSMVIKSLTVNSNPFLWYSTAYLIGLAGVILVVLGYIAYKKAPTATLSFKTAQSAEDSYKDSKGREYFYDNAKFILIFLVVLAHAISPFKDIASSSSHNAFMLLWRTINTMHMPCLIFISGFFAKKYIRPDGSINIQRPFTYIVYYLAAQITVGAFEVFVLGDSISKSVLAPRSSLWFLVCLIWWYILLPLVDKINPKSMMIIAVLAGLLIGYDDKVSNFLALSRMITHFPFFLAGYYITSGKMQQLFTKKSKLLSIPAFVIAMCSQLAIFWLFRSDGGLGFSINKFITCDSSYFKIFNDSGINPVFWFLPRVWFYLCAALLCYAFLVWVPRKKNIFTNFGARTLSVYILHRYLYLAYLEFDWHTLSWLNITVDATTAGIIMVPVSFIITVILSLYPAYLPFELLGRVSVKKLLKKSKAE